MIFIQPQGYYQPYHPIIDVEKEKTKQAKKNLFRIGLGLLVYMLITSAVQLAATFLCSRFFPNIYMQEWFTVGCSLLGYAVGLPILFGFIAAMPKQTPQKQRLGFGGWIAFLAISILLRQVGVYAAEFLITAVETLQGQEISNVVVEQTSAYSVLVNFIVTVVFAPIFEELIFRKWIIDRLLPYSEVLAVVSSGLIFGLIHGNFYQFFYAAALGMLFAAIYLQTGKIWHTIIMHAIINFTGTTIVFFLNEQLAAAGNASTIGIWDIVNILYSLSFTVLAICGFIFLLRRFKTDRLSGSGAQGLKLSSQFKATWLNWGTILLVAFCLSMFLGSLTI